MVMMFFLMMDQFWHSFYKLIKKKNQILLPIVSDFRIMVVRYKFYLNISLNVYK